MLDQSRTRPRRWTLSVSRELEEEIVRKLAVAGTVRSRRMFGGVGLYIDDFFCGIIGADSGRLYLKVDDSNLSAYEAEAMEPFPTPKGTMSYYTVPDRIVEDPKLLRAWALDACAVARKAPPSKKRKRS